MLESQYHFFEHEARISANLNVSHMANLMCPFCVQNKVSYNGKIKRKKEGTSVKRFYCTNCEKNFVVSKYHNFKKPDFVIDAFIDIMQIEPYASTKKIQKLIYEKTNNHITTTTAGKWRTFLRKGRLREYYIPKSRLNKIVSPKYGYIPKKTEYVRKGIKQTWHYNKDRLRIALNILKKYEGTIIRAKTIREAYCLNVGAPLKRTPLAKLGYIKKILDDDHPNTGGYWQILTKNINEVVKYD